MEKMCHADEFRLRLLVTDSCNMKCDYCLNDFQSTKNTNKFLDIDTALLIARKYIKFVNFMGIHTPIITISGGEPGLYPDLFKLVQSIKMSHEDCKVVICTNGKVFAHPAWRALDEYIDFLHVHIFPGTFIDFSKLTLATPVVQMVYTDNIPDKEYEEMIDYYHHLGIKFKMFVDFYGEDELDEDYHDFIQKMNTKYDNVLSRFTGLQENRGIGCDGCKLSCVTLKGMWVFPDGKISTCPQANVNKLQHINDLNLSEYIIDAYNFHKLIKKEEV